MTSNKYPAYDILTDEKENAIILKIALPGFTSNDIVVNLSNYSLNVEPCVLSEKSNNDLKIIEKNILSPSDYFRINFKLKNIYEINVDESVSILKNGILTIKLSIILKEEQNKIIDIKEE